MTTAAPPEPTLLYRLVHVDTLPTLLARGALHAPNNTPADGLPYRTIHNPTVQANRRVKTVPTGPGGTVHDYVPFYLESMRSCGGPPAVGRKRRMRNAFHRARIASEAHTPQLLMRSRMQDRRAAMSSPCAIKNRIT